MSIIDLLFYYFSTMRLCLIILFSFTLPLIGQPQNLVPNPGFEQFSKCPVKPNFTNFKHPHPPQGLKKWKQPTVGSFDYFNTCSKNGYTSAPENKLLLSDGDVCENAIQIPRSGNGDAGLVLFTGNKTGYREFMQAKLIHKLKKGKKYCVRLYYSYLTEKPSLDFAFPMGVYLSKKKLKDYKDTNYVWHITPQITSNENDTVFETETWNLLEAVFVAEGSEKFITIGNFTDPGLSKPTNCIIYTFIDDVSVTEILWAGACNTDSTFLSKPFNVNTSSESSILGFINNCRIGDLFSLEPGFFSKGEHKLLTDSLSKLLKLADVLKKNTGFEIQICSYTNCIKDENETYRLTTLRARAVVDFLCRNGVKREQVTYKAFGGTIPVADNYSAEGIKKNNRIEFRVLKK